MRRRNLRIALLVFLIIIISLLTLSFNDVDLPGESLDRGGSGPLGLVLGLDLRGGTHLVYEAESSVEIDVVFQEPVSEEELESALEELGYGNFVVAGLRKELFTIAVPAPTAGLEADLRKELEEQVGDIQDLRVDSESITQLRIILPDSPNQAALEATLQALGRTEAIVQAQGPRSFSVSVPLLDEEEEADLKKALERDLIPLEGFQVLREEGVRVELTFQQVPDLVAIESALAGLGYEQVPLETLDGKTFAASLESLQDAARIDLETVLQDKLVLAEDVVASAGERAVVQIAFLYDVDQSELESVLEDLGFFQAVITEARGTDFTIDIPALTEEQEEEIGGALGEKLSLVEDFTLRRVTPSLERMEGVVDTIERRVNAFGITEPEVQRFGDDRVIVQLPGAGDANVDVIFQESVGKESLRATLDGLGREEAKVVRSRQTPLPRTYVLTIPNLTVEGGNQLRQGLEILAGGIQEFQVDQENSQVRLTLQESVGGGILTSALLTQLGYTDAVVGRPLGSEYRIRLPSLATEEQAVLRQSLEEGLAPIAFYEVSGGVEEAKDLIGRTAQLVFKERTCLNPLCTEFTDKEAVGDKGELLTGANLNQAFAGTHPTTGLPVARFVFDGTGTRIFRDLTRRIEGDNSKCIAHLLDEEDLICPRVQRAIVGGAGFIEGPDFTFDRVRSLTIQLESGSLPVSLTLVRESTVAAILGEESLRTSLKAGLVGLALVAVFMLIYYRLAGLVAAVALTVYAVIALAIFKMVPVTLTLSGLAALIISIGMAVDANILIFERLKEELRAGRSLLSAMEIGFRRAWPAIRDSNVSTFITCGILFFFGRELGEPRIIGFAITLFVGVAVSMFTALTVSRNLLQLLVRTPMGRRLSLFTPEPLRRPVDVAGGER